MKQNLHDIEIEGLTSDEWIRLKREAEAREAEGIARAIDEAEAADLEKRETLANTDIYTNRKTQVRGMISFHARAERAYRAAGKIEEAESAKKAREALEKEIGKSES